MNNKISIGLYSSRKSEDEGTLQLAAISRFIFAFKILLRSSCKIEATFSGDGFDLEGVETITAAPNISLLITSGDAERDSGYFQKLILNGDGDSVFAVCFEPAHYDTLAAVHHRKTYPLFHEATNGKTLTFQDFFTNEAESASLLFLKVFDLIDAIQESFSETRTANTSKDTIYLALTDGKLNEERNILKRELRRLGYRVAPESMGMNKDDFNPQLSEAIERSKLSIHLIHPGEISGSAKPLSVRQNELAFRKYKNSGDTFSRILWIAGPENEGDEVSIEALKDSTEELMGAEVLQNSIETLKGLLKYKLNGNGHHASNGSITHKVHSKDLKVYFLFDKIDEDNARELISTLGLKSGDLLLPRFKGDFYQLRNHHINCLKEADMVVVYVENVNPIWLQMKFLEILKSPGMGREKKWLNQIIYLNTRQKIEWLEGNKEKMTILENDVAELANKIELGRKMLNHEGNL